MDLTILEQKLGIIFKNKDLLRQALIHRSFLNESKKEIGSNERLEFLGDSVLQLITSRYLYQSFEQAPEGILTNYRSSLVKTETLAKVAKNLELGKFLFLSKGEEESGGRENIGILADCVEAIIGAFYLDSGLESAFNFINITIFPLLPEIIQKGSFRDYKSLLQEYLQGKKKCSPFYRVLKTEGPDHERVFTIAVFAKKEEIGRGNGRSKQQAEQEAAKTALENLSTMK